MKKILAILLCTAMALSLCAYSLADESAPAEAVAFVMFADGAWANQYWTPDDAVTFTAKNVKVTGPGTYTVSHVFPKDTPAAGLSFMALGITNGEAVYPGAIYTVDEVKVNGTAIALGKTYTSTDDKIVTRNNIYNSWVTEIPADARVSGNIADYTPIAVSTEDFASYTSIEVTFTMLSVKAYIMFASADWSQQLWDPIGDGSIKIGSVDVYKTGSYEVSLDFGDSAVAGLAFMALQAVNGNITFPNYCYTITSIKINGEPIVIGKSYTSSDDSIETRSNIYNTWVTELPGDARSSDGDLTNCTPTLFDGSAVSISNIVVGFDISYVAAVVPVEKSYIHEDGSYDAFLMIADNEWSGTWANQNPGTAGDCKVTGDGIYEVYASKESLGIASDAEFGTLSVLLVDITDFGSAILQTNGYSSKDVQYIRSGNENCIIKVKAVLYVDGVKVAVDNDLIAFGNIEGNNKLRIELYNIWGPTLETPAVAEAKVKPASEVRIVLAVEGTGMNTGADIDLNTYCAAKYPQ